MMFESQNKLSVKRKYLYGLLMLSLISVICLAFSLVGNNDFDIARREILLRRIGHEILLQSGDSTSRVLPIKKINTNEYEISFEKEFSFQPNLLINTTRGVLVQDPLAADYVVNVLNCANGSVAYGYAISKNKQEDIVACIGRIQPKACYKIHLQFKSAGKSKVNGAYFFGALLLLILGGLVFWRLATQRKVEPAIPDEPAIPAEPALPENTQASTFTLGSIVFDAANRTLNTNDTTIDLTNTETRVLRIFAMSPNEVIERNRLQKEIWEDEGVIVGRSLDMFISKLRKKLEVDPNVKIAVIRAKGYKLEICG
jgi:hypothetical protein